MPTAAVGLNSTEYRVTLHVVQVQVCGFNVAVCDDERHLHVVRDTIVYIGSPQLSITGPDVKVGRRHG